MKYASGFLEQKDNVLIKYKNYQFIPIMLRILIRN